VKFWLGLIATIAGCSCSGPQTSASAPKPGDDTCVMPQVANCLNGDSGIVACEKQSDTRCGLAAGTSAQVWAGVEQAEILQGMVPRGH
jgi:hypothetical protein